MATRRFFVLPGVLFLLSLTATIPLADTAAQPSLVRLPLKGTHLLGTLHKRGIEVIGITRDGYVDVVADADQLRYLQSLGQPLSVIGTPDMPSATLVLDDDLGEYHTYAEAESVLTALASAYPSLTDLQVIGTSVEGRNISVLKISDSAASDESEPEVLIMGCHHARELMSVDIPLRFAMYLLENYGIDGTVTQLVDSREVFIVPMINPDGHVYVENDHAGPWWTWWRKNRRDNGDGTFGVDLNRNYGYQWGYDNLGSSPTTSSELYRGTGPFSEPETQAVRDFCASRHFSVGLSYHSYGQLLLLPWGYVYDYTDDHNTFVALGDTLASGTGYFVGNPAMGAIYITNGGSDDWAYGEDVAKNSFFMYTPEVNTSEQGGFGPPDSLIQPTFDLLLPMNLTLLEFADEPRRVLGPYTPTMYPIDDTWSPHYVVSWSDNDPMDPNPAASYDVCEYLNYGFIDVDSANADTGLWVFDGFTVSGARAYDGVASYYSGSANNSQRAMTAAVFYQVEAESDTFTAWMWYDIETDWDYAYLEVSTDAGLIWQTVPGNITTNSNPNGNNRGNGITGSSGGWVQAVFPLTTYVGESVQLRVNYVMDQSVLGEGLYVDLPGPVPTYESKSTVASSHTGTSIVLAPPSTGMLTYQVRGRDADGQESRWSNTESIEVTTTTAVADPPRFDTALGASYPNPFNPETHIPYTVGSDVGEARVSLAIYNVAGERVAVLVDGPLPPGLYRARWRGLDQGGAPVASGVYFARLIVGDRGPFVRKLVLLK